MQSKFSAGLAAYIIRLSIFLRTAKSPSIISVLRTLCNPMQDLWNESLVFNPDLARLLFKML